MIESLRAYWRESKKAQRDARAAAGWCPNHPMIAPAAGLVHCALCLRLWSDLAKARRARAREGPVPE